MYEQFESRNWHLACLFDLNVLNHNLNRLSDQFFPILYKGSPDFQAESVKPSPFYPLKP